MILFLSLKAALLYLTSWLLISTEVTMVLPMCLHDFTYGSHFHTISEGWSPYPSVGRPGTWSCFSWGQDLRRTWVQHTPHKLQAWTAMPLLMVLGERYHQSSPSNPRSILLPNSQIWCWVASQTVHQHKHSNLLQTEQPLACSHFWERTLMRKHQTTCSIQSQEHEQHEPHHHRWQGG